VLVAQLIARAYPAQGGGANAPIGPPDSPGGAYPYPCTEEQELSTLCFYPNKTRIPSLVLACPFFLPFASTCVSEQRIALASTE